MTGISVLQKDLGVDGRIDNIQAHGVFDGMFANLAKTGPTAMSSMLVAPSLISSSKHSPGSPNNISSPNEPSEISCSSSSTSDTLSEHGSDLGRAENRASTWSSTSLKIRALEKEEPILRENEDRFSMFPILWVPRFLLCG